MKKQTDSIKKIEQEVLKIAIEITKKGRINCFFIQPLITPLL